MNKKQQEMIRILAEQSKPMTSVEIANALGVTSRSIKNYVHEINGFYGKTIISSTKNGYSLNAKTGSNLLVALNDEKIPQTLEERSFYIIKQLILNHAPYLELFDLCDFLCVSYSTIKSVISKMNKTFSAYHVEFQCENDCVYIKGSEYSKRRLISYVINEESKNSYLNINMLRSTFKNIDVVELQNMIQEIFNSHNYYLNDFSATNLLLHLLIILERELSGNVLKSEHAKLKIESLQEETLLQDLIDRLEETYDINFNVSEIYEIYTLFKANATCCFERADENLKEIVPSEIICLIDEYVSKINERYMIDLSSSSFTTPFALHLKNLIYRAKNLKETKNPIAESIKQNSPIVFDIAVYISLDLMNRYNIKISEDEAAFLAMHIGAELERQNINHEQVPAVLICPNYHDIATSVFNTLMLNFGQQINITGVFANEAELKQKKLPNNSIVFTTVPLAEPIQNAEVLKISPFNLSSQFETIQNLISKAKERYKSYKLKLNFHTFFEEDLFVVNPNFHDKQQILTYLCDTLVVKNYVESDFEEKVYQRENVATTSFGHVAIPHSVEMNAIKTSISVAISKKGFQWDSNTVNVVFLLAINKADRQNFRYLYESLISLFGEDEIIQEIKSCNNFKDFKKLIYSKIEIDD